MKAFATSLALFAAAANANVLARAVCNADGCARAVTGTATKPALSVRTADCSSFQRTTVTPATSTITEQAASVVTEYSKTTSTTYLSTVTSFVPYTTQTVVKRDASGSLVFNFPPAPAVTQAPRALAERADPIVPAYASSCSGAVRYASACSCYGITSAVTTLPTPLSTTTTTSTTTSTVSVSETQPTFVVKSVVCKPEDDYGYKYINVGSAPGLNVRTESFTTDRAGCCALCYQSPDKHCGVYGYYSGLCIIGEVEQGELPATASCPNGVSAFGGRYFGDPRIGFGPCGLDQWTA